VRDYDTGPAPQEPVRPARVGRTAEDIASPAPLGLNVLAFATAILGCFYAGFIIPYQGIGIRPALGAVLLVLGIVLILAGMWEYRKNSMVSATIFASYGGFLAAIGLIFMPNLGILSFLLASRELNFAMGLFFLCWTIFAAILFVGTLKTNISLAVTMGILVLAYLLLTIGQLASNNSALNHVGGWLAIIAALAAWYTGLASLLSSTDPNTASRLLGRRMTPVE
jgi:succinate-acetate transporter protein